MKNPAHQGNKKGAVPPAAYRYKPGQSGNIKGRPAAGASVKEWWNQMAEWSLAKVKAVMEDAKASIAKKAAARAWIDAASEDRNAAGSPIATAELKQIIEHTDGKAQATVDVTSGGQTIYKAVTGGASLDDL